MRECTETNEKIEYWKWEAKKKTRNENCAYASFASNENVKRGQRAIERHIRHSSRQSRMEWNEGDGDDDNDCIGEKWKKDAQKQGIKMIGMPGSDAL